MRTIDVFLILLGAIQPFLIKFGFIDYQSFLPIHILYLGIVFIYFFLKIAKLYFNTFSKATVLALSLNVDMKDILVGGVWGLTLYRYFELGFGSFIFWLLIGLIAIVIGFLPDFLVSEELGIKQKKGGKWITWNDITEFIQNEFYFAFKTTEGSTFVPFLLTETSKNNQNALKKVLPEISTKHNINLAETSEAILLLVPEIDFSVEEETLDDFAVKKKNFIVLTNEIIILSKKNKRIEWDNVIDVLIDEYEITFRLNRPGGFTLFSEHYTGADWEKLVSKLQEER